MSEKEKVEVQFVTCAASYRQAVFIPYNRHGMNIKNGCESAYLLMYYDRTPNKNADVFSLICSFVENFVNFPEIPDSKA